MKKPGQWLSIALLFTASFCLGMGSIHAAPGDLDSTFGNLGELPDPINQDLYLGIPGFGGRNIAVQSDGKIVLIGAAFNLPQNSPLFKFYVERLCTNGQKDNGSNCGSPGFGVDGVMSSAFGNRTSDDRDVPQALAIQKDGKIVVAGYTYNNHSNSLLYTIARYNTDGPLDQSFGDFDLSSKVTRRTGTTSIKINNSAIDLQDVPLAIALQSDSKIVLAGKANNHFAVFRLNIDGSLDSTFGFGGIVILNFSSFDEAEGIALQSDGKIVAVGTASDTNFFSYSHFGDLSANARAVVVRLNSNGSLDPSFVNGTKPTANTGTALRAVALQKNGTIVAAGEAIPPFGPNGLLMRLDSNGNLITNRFTDFTQFKDVAIDRGGKIIAVGPGTYFPDPSFLVVRFCTDGSLDNATNHCSLSPFGPDGNGFTVIPPPDSDTHPFSAFAVTIENAKILVSGIEDISFGKTILERFNGDCGNGVIDPGENCDGKNQGICPQFNTTCNPAACVCMLCGNGVKAPNEECDEGAQCDDGTECDITEPNACADGSICVPRESDTCTADCKLKVQSEGEFDEVTGGGCGIMKSQGFEGNSSFHDVDLLILAVMIGGTTFRRYFKASK